MINTNVFFDVTDFQVRRTGLDPQQRESHAGERQPGLGERHEHVARGMHAVKNNNGTAQVGPLSVPSVLWVFLCCVGDFPLTTMVLCRCFSFVLESSL